MKEVGVGGREDMLMKEVVPSEEACATPVGSR